MYLLRPAACRGHTPQTRSLSIISLYFSPLRSVGLTMHRGKAHLPASVCSLPPYPRTLGWRVDWSPSTGRKGMLAVRNGLRWCLDSSIKKRSPKHALQNAQSHEHTRIRTSGDFYGYLPLVTVGESSRANLGRRTGPVVIPFFVSTTEALWL